MGLMDKIKGVITPQDDSYDNEYDDEIYPGTNDEYINQQPQQQGSNLFNPQPSQQFQSPPMNTTPMNQQNNFSMTGTSGVQSSVELKIVRPENYENVQKIADILITKKTIVLNLEETNKEVSRRLIDYLSGVAYALRGQVKRVANNTYIITPNNVDVSGEQIKEDR